MRTISYVGVIIYYMCTFKYSSETKLRQLLKGSIIINPTKFYKRVHHECAGRNDFNELNLLLDMLSSTLFTLLCIKRR